MMRRKEKKEQEQEERRKISHGPVGASSGTGPVRCARSGSRGNRGSGGGAGRSGGRGGGRAGSHGGGWGSPVVPVVPVEEAVVAPCGGLWEGNIGRSGGRSPSVAFLKLLTCLSLFLFLSFFLSFFPTFFFCFFIIIFFLSISSPVSFPIFASIRCRLLNRGYPWTGRCFRGYLSYPPSLSLSLFSGPIFPEDFSWSCQSLSGRRPHPANSTNDTIKATMKRTQRIDSKLIKLGWEEAGGEPFPWCFCSETQLMAIPPHL